MKINLVKQCLNRFHRNDGGNMGTLLLLTIFALVGILALVWNSADIGTRREKCRPLPTAPRTRQPCG